jgi:hypothetical protein
VIGKVLQVGCKVTSIRSSQQISSSSSSSLRCPFTEGKGRTYQRSVPLFEGLGTRALREDAVPYSPSSMCPKTKEQCPSPIPIPIPKGEGAQGVP